MYEDEENKIVPKVSYKSVCQESDYDNILRYIETKSIDSKLESGPIKSLSKNKELRRRSRGHGLEISLISQRKSQTVNNSNYVSVCSR